MADRVRLLAAAALMGSLTACAPMYGQAPPGRMATLPSDNGTFRASDFAWSQTPGRNGLAGSLSHSGPVHYTCAGATVVLTPETPWARRRMMVLYKSDQRAALPADDVRSRQSQAPPGDSNPYLKRAVCDASDRFSFANLPDGAWYAVTLAKPASGAGGGPSLALMRRVTTHGARVTVFEF